MINFFSHPLGFKALKKGAGSGSDGQRYGTTNPWIRIRTKMSRIPNTDLKKGAYRQQRPPRWKRRRRGEGRVEGAGRGSGGRWRGTDQGSPAGTPFNKEINREYHSKYRYRKFDYFFRKYFKGSG
jgi:hypothetical protein